jgi:hypothetical protein
MQGDIALAILRRLIDRSGSEISPPLAEAVLHLQFADSEQARMTELGSKSNRGTLTAEEAEELDGYIAAADLLSLWQSKARLALKHHPSAA